MAALPIVCLAVGEPHARTDLYIERLHGMLRRHCDRPFELHCYSDRPRRLPAGVKAHDCSGWTELDRPDLRPTTRKLGLFNPRYAAFDEFLYLDLSIVIRHNMAELLDGALRRPEALLIVPNWHYDGYNSSVMRIRAGPLAPVYDAFVAGERYPQRVPGDQDFLHGAVAAHGLRAQVGLLPTHQVVSFKKTLEAGRADAAVGRARVEAATIVKFHGRPKMDEAFAPRFRLWRVRLRELVKGHGRPVMPLGALRREWLGVGPVRGSR